MHIPEWVVWFLGRQWQRNGNWKLLSQVRLSWTTLDNAFRLKSGMKPYCSICTGGTNHMKKHYRMNEPACISSCRGREHTNMWEREQKYEQSQGTVNQTGKEHTKMKKNNRMKDPRVLATTMERPIAPSSLNRLTAIVCMANMIAKNQKNLYKARHLKSSDSTPTAYN